MDTKITPNDKSNDINNQEKSTSIFLREDFYKWLSDGNAKKYSPQVITNCLDRICEYIESKKIYYSLWKISTLGVFKPVYQKVLNEKLLRVMERNTYKVFIVAGQLYMKFLKKKPWIADGKFEKKILVAKKTSSFNRKLKKENITQDYHTTDREKSIKVIAMKFKNGIRKSSSIDFERFKSFYVEEFGTDFLHDADWLRELLLKESLLYDNRAYIYGENVVRAVISYLEQMDSPCVSIDIFFNKYNSEFYDFAIFSTDMLLAFIEKNYSNISVKYGYLLLQENTTPADLIRERFEERETWSIDELQEKLPGIKNETIRQIMTSAEYFRVEKGVYTHIDNMDLPDSEGQKIAEYIENQLISKEYVIANELDLAVFIERNSHCSFLTIRDTVFYKFLSAKYEKSGQIITRKGVKLCVIDILEQYCREVNTVTFEELNELEATFDPGGRSHSKCLTAGHKIMVRVSYERFVANSKVNFAVEQIDEVIALYCQGDFIPLRVIVDFSLFPYIEYTWNLFLLESYLRRFSQVFKYDVRGDNSGNIGVIIRKSFAYNDYDDILVVALAKSSISLEDKKTISNYLFDEGYIGWRNLGKNENKIIRKAMALREGEKV